MSTCAKSQLLYGLSSLILPIARRLDKILVSNVITVLLYFHASSKLKVLDLSAILHKSTLAFSNQLMFSIYDGQGGGVEMW